MSLVFEIIALVAVGALGALLYRLIFRVRQDFWSNAFLGFIMALVTTVALGMLTGEDEFPVWLRGLIALPLSVLFIWVANKVKRK